MNQIQNQLEKIMKKVFTVNPVLNFIKLELILGDSKQDLILSNN